MGWCGRWLLDSAVVEAVDASAAVVVAASATGGRLPRDFTSDEMPLKDAVSSAVRLANELKVALVVQDPDGLWQADWGTLYRYDGDDADGP